MPELGQLAPDFELNNQNGQPVKLSDYRGKKVVLFAFPKANTAGCNAQACGFRDEFETIDASNAVIFGISGDSVDTLKQWKQNKSLPYDLLSDPGHKMLEAWGAWGVPMIGLVRLPMIQRSYWVIDEQGKLVDKKVPVSPGDSVKRALEAVQVDVAGAPA
ncbi:MAG TPA: peroxiredoxin [Candidatus Limnocylindrales bacterium]|nr:peroxiredoxin [Candidatus Limnocylindrales bacterium]